MDKNSFLALVRQCFDEIEGNTGYLPLEDTEIPVLEEPLVGFASADDPVFELFSDENVIGPEWRSPVEWLNGARTAVAFFFPFTEEVKRRVREEKGPVSAAWNICYGRNNYLVNQFTDSLIARLEKEGIRACAPVRSPDFRRNVIKTVNGEAEDLHYSVSWSNRHICYAAGLGTFGIHRHIITEKGCCGTLGSIVMDLEIEPTKRQYKEIYGYCDKCGRCISRCPVNAITKEHLRNLKICSTHAGALREKYDGAMCGKCLVGIPCESAVPSDTSAKDEACDKV